METSSNRAVSPVVGVILMVAITVILAAVIGSFVLTLGTDNASAAAGISVDQQPNTSAAGGEELVLTAVSMDRADDVYVKAHFPNGPKYANDLGGEDRIAIPDEYSSTPQYSLQSAGDSMVLEIESPTAGTDEIVKLTIIAEYEGEKTVLQTYVVE